MPATGQLSLRYDMTNSSPATIYQTQNTIKHLFKVDLENLKKDVISVLNDTIFSSLVTWLVLWKFLLPESLVLLGSSSQCSGGPRGWQLSTHSEHTIEHLRM